jgi:hypothetical protein
VVPGAGTGRSSRAALFAIIPYMKDILALIHSHIVSLISEGGLLLLFISAYIQHMPDRLPESFRDFPQWAWSWNAASLKAFMNARAGATASHVESVDPSGARHTADTASSTLPAATVVSAAPLAPSGLERDT